MAAGAMLRVSAQRKHLAAIRDFIREQADEAGAGPGDIDSLVQAVDEAASNIILHGYHEEPGMIEIEVKSRPDQVAVILRDSAPFFDPTRVQAPDINLPLEQRPIGGLGIHLIRHCVDEFSHCVRDQGGNELLMVKYLRKKTG